MQTIQELTDVEQLILRTLFFAPRHQATFLEIADKCYYPDQQVLDTLQALEEQGLVNLIADFGTNTQVYHPSEAMIEQMETLNKKANANLQAGLVKALESQPIQKKQPRTNKVPSLTYAGVTHNLDEWITYGEYGRKYGINQTTITMRILRGNFPPENILDLPRWGIKLLKDVAPNQVDRGRKPKAS
ncbi:hypothetical protein [Fibrella forsythiae]|uniref:MarR family transcriptional regulator n=1 Tax=Fibrella forsythiae TaxID=2817061 RepID=A0ABS3JB63_9BACT|nr:hypothetical protein [Fibrella forsythiae]MBO0947225.1 hypothetical protein [Fibrella forsythiae]